MKVKIISVEEMAKRRKENIIAFRKMEKPGYNFSEEYKKEMKNMKK